MSHILINMKKEKQKFQLRSFTSFSLVISTIIMSWSGFILYIAPPGRIANWGSWKLMLFTKAEWQALHTIFSYLFFILVIIHLFFVNWKAFLTYFKSKVMAGLNRKWELVASISISGIIFAGTLRSWTPFGPVMIFGDKVKESWETKFETPPVIHMEDYTLLKLSSDFGDVSPEQLLKTLNENNIEVSDTSISLETIARENHTTPVSIYNMLRSEYDKEPQRSGGGNQAGYGRYTVKIMSDNTGRGLSALIRILEEKGIEANGETSLRTIANELGVTPREVYNMLAE